jgi:hypothetical protein
MDRAGTTPRRANGLRAEVVKTPSGLRQAFRLPFQIYRREPAWIPPLLRGEKRRLNPQEKPFFASESFYLRVENGAIHRTLNLLPPMLFPEVLLQAIRVFREVGGGRSGLT